MTDDLSLKDKPQELAELNDQSLTIEKIRKARKALQKWSDEGPPLLLRLSPRDWCVATGCFRCWLARRFKVGKGCHD